jgi:hypothetical protein
MSRRDVIRMSDDEIADFIDAQKTLTIVSNGVGGFPHPMPMWFARDADGSIRMATYRTSQKIKNIQRDPKVTLLAETGTEYAQLMGVVIYGEAEIVDDYDLVIDTLLRAGGATGLPNDPEEAAKVRESMHGTASKRYAIHIRPQRIVSWNHAKLKGTY